MKIKLAAAAAVLVIAVFALTGCAGRELIGTWKGDVHAGANTVIFKADKSFVISKDGEKGTVAGSYAVHGSTLTMTASGQSASCTFAVKGNVLTLTYKDASSGKTVTNVNTYNRVTPSATGGVSKTSNLGRTVRRELTSGGASSASSK